MSEGAEPDAVHRGDRTRAHRKDITQDSADASRRALKWFNERGVIVGFYFEGSAPAVAESNNAGVFSGRNDYALARCWQAFQMDPRRLVGTVLAPHPRKDSQFDEVGLAA